MHKHHHTKVDGRDLFLYSEQPREYQITNDLEPLDSPPAPHKRWHPLRQEWVLYNAARNKRTLNPPPEYNPLGPVAPDGFPGEIPTPDFEIAVFENRWPGLHESAPGRNGLEIDAPGARGRCEVVVYGTSIEQKLTDLSDERVAMLVKVWADRHADLCAREGIKFVLPFESRGAFVGVTLPHPHGQIYAFDFVPPIIQRQVEAEREHGVLAELIATGGSKTLRVDENDSAWSLVPAFSRYPFETWILPKRQVASPGQLTADELLDFARILKQTVGRLDGLFDSTMPFCMWVSLPPKGAEEIWPFHIQFMPMQRTANSMKYLASVEQISQIFLSDVLPEDAAEKLRAAG